MCVNTSGSREWAATGQVGKWPPVFVWNTQTGEKRSRLKLEKGARAVAAVCISGDGKWVATADKHNDHNVKIPSSIISKVLIQTGRKFHLKFSFVYNQVSHRQFWTLLKLGFWVFDKTRRKWNSKNLLWYASVPFTSGTMPW